jgi:hypothetical protein
VVILLQAKLDHKFYNNDFDYCRLIIPFPNRGTIESSKDAPTAGEVVISADQKALVWNMGTKFTGKNMEVALKTTVVFSGQAGVVSDTDPFLMGPNSYVKVLPSMSILTSSLSLRLTAKVM